MDWLQGNSDLGMLLIEGGVTALCLEHSSTERIRRVSTDISLLSFLSVFFVPVSTVLSRRELEVRSSFLEVQIRELGFGSEDVKSAITTCLRLFESLDGPGDELPSCPQP